MLQIVIKLYFFNRKSKREKHHAKLTTFQSKEKTSEPQSLRASEPLKKEKPSDSEEKDGLYN